MLRILCRDIRQNMPWHGTDVGVSLQHLRSNCFTDRANAHNARDHDADHPLHARQSRATTISMLNKHCLHLRFLQHISSMQVFKIKHSAIYYLIDAQQQ